MGNAKRKLFAGLICLFFSVIMLAPIIGKVQGAIYATGKVKDYDTHEGINRVHVTIYGRYEENGRLKTFSKSGYTNSNGAYKIRLPSTTLYTNRIRTLKTGFKTYDGPIVNPIYLLARDITLRFYGNVGEDHIIDNIKRTNVELPVSLDFSVSNNGGTIPGYTNILVDQSISIKIFDKCNNLLKIVNCNQATGDYDTGYFPATAGGITFKIESIPTTSNRQYKTLTYTEEFLSSDTINKDFYLKRDLGEVRANGGLTGAFDGFTNHIMDVRFRNMPLWDGLLFNAKSTVPKTIVYEPWDSDFTHTYIASEYDITGVQPILDKCITPGARVSLYAKNCWSGNLDFISLSGINYEGYSDYKTANFDWNFQASLGYSGAPTPWNGQIQLSTSYEQKEGVRHFPVTNDNTQIGEWTRLGYIDVDYSNDKTNLQKRLDLVWDISIANGREIGELYSLYECGSRFQFKIIYEFNIQQVELGIWTDYIGKVIVEQIIGDYEESGIIINYIIVDSDFQCVTDNLGSYSAEDYIINLLRGEPAITPIQT